MSISERTLRKWRKEALIHIHKPTGEEDNPEYIDYILERILQMTQVLLDQHLLNKGK